MKNKVWKLISLITITIFVLSAANTVHAQTLVSTGIGVYPTGVAYDPSTNQVYVVNPDAGTISVISDNSNTVTQTITGLTSTPYAMAYDSNTNEMYVSSSGGVYVIPDNSASPSATIPIAQGCIGIAYDSGTHEIYVCDSYTMNVSVISDSSNTIVRNITINSYAGSLAYDSVKKEMFVSVTIGVDVSIIPDNSNSVTKTIKVATNPYLPPGSLVYDSKGKIYVTNSTDISVISDSSNTITKVINNVVSVGSPGSLVYDFTDGKIICNSGEVISESSNSVTATLDVGTNPAGIAYDSNNGNIYVTNSNDPGTVTGVQVSSGTPSTSSPTISPASSPTVPEFGSIALIAVTAAMITLTVSAVALKAKTKKTVQKIK